MPENFSDKVEVTEVSLLLINQENNDEKSQNGTFDSYPKFIDACEWTSSSAE
jgi:hypothetical protein|tara:strand:+ start:6671 stop:6826 length:156 start_codon:yes stop_codon:yes gene_type:complete